MKSTLLRTIVAAAALSATVLGCSVNPVTGEKEFIIIPESEEIAMGAQAAPEFETEFDGPVDDAVLQSYVRQVGAKLAAVSDRQMPYEYTLLRSDVPNAFALPGGKIYVTAGLLKIMTNERELAAVLGHETGHVAAKHNVKGLQRQMGAAVLVELAGIAAGADKAEAAKVGAQVASNMVTLSYSRDDEYQADEIGIKYMTRAGYNPLGMVELLEALKSLHESEPGRLGEMFQTHPLTSKRIDHAKGIIEDSAEYRSRAVNQPDPNAARFAQMKKRLK